MLSGKPDANAIHTGTHTRPPCLDDEGLQNDLVTNITASKVIESNHYSRTLKPSSSSNKYTTPGG